MKHRLPAYMAEQPARATARDLGIADTDPHGILLAAAYRLAARLERRLDPWDSDGTRATSLDIPMGPVRVQLRAAITDPTNDEDDDEPPATEKGSALVRTPGGGQRTVTVTTIDHGPVTVTCPTWCGVQHENDGYRADIVHESPDREFRIPVTGHPVYLLALSLEERPFTDLPQGRAPFLTIGTADGDWHPADSAAVDQLADALAALAPEVRTAGRELAALLEEETTR